MLDSLIESLLAARLVLLVNYRPEYRHAWGGKTYYRQFRIDPLPPESADPIRFRAVDGGSCMPEIAARISVDSNVRFGKPVTDMRFWLEQAEAEMRDLS